VDQEVLVEVEEAEEDLVIEVVEEVEGEEG
jgi:hypothetical protein